MDWTSILEEHRTSLFSLFHHLHEHAEISWNEHETTKLLSERMRQLGFRVTTYDDGPGFIAEYGPQEGPVVALRTDIDALWQEVDGTWKANHSCGHDAHMTVVTGAAMLLKQAIPNPDVRIRILYQPAEEVGEGAARMVERGAVDDVSYLFGIHLRPIEELPTGRFSACIRNGGAVHIDARVTGVSAHGARPHIGINGIEVAFACAQAIQTIHLNPMVPYSVKMTRIQGGGQSTNIIPDVCEFSYDLRAQTNAALDELIKQVEYRIEQTARMMGADVSIHRGARIMAAEVGLEAQTLMAEAIVSLFDADKMVPEIVSPGAEDFHYYTSLRPGLQATMLGLGCNLQPGLHHPKMVFDKEAMFDGMTILAETAWRAVQAIANVRK